MKKHADTIGGLDPSLWLNRLVFIPSQTRSPSMACARIISIEKDHAVCQPQGHRNSAPLRIPFNRIKPWWARNPDLKEIVDA